MEKKIFNKILYYQKGFKPKILIISGVHGDEASVIPVLSKWIMQNENRLSDFIFIPEASPSAVRLKRRQNEFNHDLNREFVKNSPDLEAQSFLAIIKDLKFDQILSFHEDVDRKEFYFYAFPNWPKKRIDEFDRKLKDIDVKLYSGIDDPDDPILGSKANQGYIYAKDTDPAHFDGQLSDWCVTNKITRSFYDFEIPTRANLAEKTKLVDVISRFMMVPEHRLGG
jgi:hypothetical protein